MTDSDELFLLAMEAASNSYSPYSRFRVGAAIQFEDGGVFTGTNVENRSFGLTICAERSAVVAAIGAGKRRILAIAIATPDSAYPVSPCGACRQVLSEFSLPDTPVQFGPSITERILTTIGALFPYDALRELAGSDGKHA